MINYKKTISYIAILIISILSIRGAYEFIKDWNKSYVISQATTNKDIRVIIEAAVADTLLNQIEKPYQESNYQDSEIKGSTERLYKEFYSKVDSIQLLKDKLYAKIGIIISAHSNRNDTDRYLRTKNK